MEASGSTMATTVQRDSPTDLKNSVLKSLCFIYLELKVLFVTQPEE